MKNSKPNKMEDAMEEKKILSTTNISHDAIQKVIKEKKERKKDCGFFRVDVSGCWYGKKRRKKTELM